MTTLDALDQGVLDNPAWAALGPRGGVGASAGTAGRFP